MSRFVPVKDADGKPKKVSLFAWYGVKAPCRRIRTAECPVGECIAAEMSNAGTGWRKIKKCRGEHFVFMDNLTCNLELELTHNTKRTKRKGYGST